ncbi:MAG: glycosyltransferase family 2 protein [Planctomycetota bacterium]|jgi:glycosyltransferase involved in cell wall biosynthesis
METPVLSLVVPVYNERDSIETTADALRQAEASVGGALEVVLVDDGSEDGTGELLDSLAGGAVKVIHHGENRGYGAAIKTGVRSADGDVIGIIDADGTYPAERFGDLLRVMDEGDCDMVVGARTEANAAVPPLRRPAKWALNRLASFLAGRNIPDLNSGMRVMKRGTLERFLRILPDGFSFTTTITLAMLTNGLSVRFIPIEYRTREGASKIRPIYDTLNFVQLICRTALYFNPLRIFIPLSLALVALSIVVLVGSAVFFEKIMDVTFGVVFMSAVIVLAIGLLADLIDKRTPL